MKSLKIFYLVGFALLTIGVSSCGSNNCDDLTAEVNALTMDFNAAVTAFNADPTPENCETFRDEFQDYLDGLKDWSDCAEEVGGTNLDELITQAEADLDDLEC